MRVRIGDSIFVGVTRDLVRIDNWNGIGLSFLPSGPDLISLNQDHHIEGTEGDLRPHSVKGTT